MQPRAGWARIGHACAMVCRARLGLLAVVLAAACSDGDDGGGGDAASTSETSPSAESDVASSESAVDDAADGDPRCNTGCEATMAAACSGGPSTLEICIDDCNELATGGCAAEYQTLTACADGKPVGCDATGFPLVSDCQSVQMVFIQCINR